MLQEVVAGEGSFVVSCKIYATDDGRILGAVPGAKLTIYPPVFGVSQSQEARHIPQVEEGTVRLLESIGYRGALASVEWKYDPREETWKMLEINPRSVMAIALMRYGADILDMLYRDKLGLEEPPQRPVKYGRRWAYIKNGLLLHKRHPEERPSWREYLHLYRPGIVFGLLDWRDPRPFFYDIMPLIKRRI
jgi:predicted ATP-grasp superfamily ATP-dependent carboligase